MKVFRTALAVRLPIAQTMFLALLGAALVACGGGDEEAEEERLRQPTLAPPATAAPIEEDTVEPEAETDAEQSADEDDGQAEEQDDEGSEESAEATPRVVELPADGNVPVIQIARIENTPWEPQILAQMVPHLSVQANGFTVFSSPYGQSHIGWHQTNLSQADVLAFLKLLVEDIGVLELNSGIAEDELSFATLPDGAPANCDAYGVIAIQTAAEEGRLIISECELENPTGDDIEAKKRLRGVVDIIEQWKRVVDHSGVSPENQAAFKQLMGWYSPIRQPYTPESVVGFGTRARGSIPADSSISGWPLDLPLGESFDADFGADPTEVVINGEDVQRALLTSLAFALENPPSYWGPLYMDEDRTLYSVAFRAAAPGANNVVVDYEYTPPIRGIGIGR